MTTATLEPATGELGATLRRLRRERGLSLDQLSERTSGGLTKGAVSHIERGDRYPNVDSLRQLAAALDIAFMIDPAGVAILTRT